MYNIQRNADVLRGPIYITHDPMSSIDINAMYTLVKKWKPITGQKIIQNIYRLNLRGSESLKGSVFFTDYPAFLPLLGCSFVASIFCIGMKLFQNRYRIRLYLSRLRKKQYEAT